MLNRIRRIGGTPQRNNRQNSDAGFICPMCRAVFDDPVALTKHFDDAHGESEKNSTTEDGQTSENIVPVKSFSNHEGDQSRYEKVGDDKLKVENDKLKNVLQEKELQIEKMNHDIELLEKYKNLGQDAEMLQQQLTMSIDSNEAIARQKDDFEQKAAKLSEDVVTLKAECDKITSAKDDLINRNENLSVELEKAATWVKDLESQLMQRPSLDDVNVLKKELVSVQMMMNQMTLDSEKEKEGIINVNKQLTEKLTLLQGQNLKFHKDVEDLKRQNQILQKTYDDSIKSAEGLKNNLEQSHDHQTTKLQENLSNLQQQLQHEQVHSRSLDEKNNVLQGELNQFRISAGEFERKLMNTVDNLRKMENDYNKLKDTTNALQNENNALKANKEKLIKEKGETLTELKNELLDRKERGNSLKLANQELYEQQKSLQIDKDNLAQKNLMLEEQCSNLKNKNQELELKSSMNAQEQSSNAKELELKANSLHAVNEQLQKVIQDKNKEIKLIQDDFSGEKSLLQSTLLDKEKSLVKVQLEFDHLQTKYQSLIGESSALQAKLNSKENEHSTISEELKDVKLKLDISEETEKDLKQDLEAFKSKLSGEIIEKDNLISELKKLRDERSVLLKNIEVGEGQNEVINQLETENKNLRIEKEDLKCKVNELITNNDKQLSANQNEAKLLKSNLLQFQQTIESLNAKLEKLSLNNSDLEQQNSDLLSSFKNKTNMLKEEIEKNSQIKLDLTSESQVYQNQLQEKVIEFEKVSASLQEVKTAHENLLNKNEIIIKAHQDEVINFQKQICTSEVFLSQSKDNVKSLENKLSTLFSEKEGILSQHKSYVENLKTNHKVALKNIQEELKLQKTESVELNKTVASLTSKCQLLQESLSKSEDNVKNTQADLLEESEVLKALQVEYANHKKDSIQQNENIQKLLNEVTQKLEKEKYKFEKASEDYLSQIATFEQKIIASEKQAMEKDDEIKRLINEIAMAKDEVNQKDNQMTEYTKQISRFQTESDQLKSDLNDIQRKLSAANADQLQFAEKAETVRISKDAVIIENQKTIDEYKSKIDDLTTDVNRKILSIKEGETAISELKNNLSAEQNRISELDNILNEKNIMYDKAQQKIKQLENATLELKASTEKNNELTASIDILNKKNKNLSSELEKSNKQLTEKISENELQAQKFVAVESDLNAKVSKMEEMVKDLNNKLEAEYKNKVSLESKLVEQKKQIDLDIKQKESDWAAEKQELLENQSTLKGAQQILINNKMEVQGKLDKVEIELKQKEILIADIEKKAIEDAGAALLEQSRLSKALEDTKSVLQNQKQEKEEQIAKLKLEVGTLKENLDAVRCEWQASIQQIDNLKTQCDDSKGHVVVLEATIQNNADERRALLERCLKAEQQVENKQLNEIQMKKKLEDAHAAMHELGRENQALQVKHTSVLSRQWADDKQAIECKSCGTPFSITVRKHHCRHCGNIYCSECSAKTATVAASKKPVRVCDKCYDDLFTMH